MDMHALNGKEKSDTGSSFVPLQYPTAEQLQRAVVWSEVLGQPRGRRRRALQNGNQCNVSR